MSYNFKSKKIIISAGATGIGWATAKECLEKGAKGVGLLLTEAADLASRAESARAKTDAAYNDDEIKEIDEQVVFDYKTKFRRQQIEAEGNDPAKSGQSQGTPSDMAMGRTGHELNDKGGAPEGGFEGAGRPKEISHYGKDGSARGRDPVGKHDLKKAGSHAPKYGTKKNKSSIMENYKKNLELLTKNHVYSKEMEHDACGVGLIASTEGKKSRAIVEYGIEALKAVWHRGAVDSDGKTGDGA